MKMDRYSRRRELQKIPTKYFVASGFGESDITYHAGSFHMALQECGIENYNIMRYSSVLPKNCVETDEKPEMVHGAVMDTIYASCDGEEGDLITAGLIIGDLVKKTNREKIGSLVCEIGEKSEPEAVEVKLKQAIEALYVGGYKEEHDLDNLRVEIRSNRVTKKYGTVLVAIAFTEYEHIFSPVPLKIAPFMAQQGTEKTAEAIFVPVLYDASATYRLGASEGALHILDASTYLENYDIETDTQPIQAGFFTREPIVSGENPIRMVEMVSAAVTRALENGQFPVLIGGGHEISLGAFQAVTRYHKDCTILHLDAHTDLRSSFDGTPYSEACVMSRALELTKNVVQVGIRSMSKREQNAIQYDKLFFAQDIKDGTDIWIDDVLAECTPNVYITVDVDVFDPSIVSSGTPEPDGLLYSHVLKLVRKLTQSRRIVGMDVNNFIPTPGTTAPEFTLAKLIYQTFAFRRKYQK